VRKFRFLHPLLWVHLATYCPMADAIAQNGRRPEGHQDSVHVKADRFIFIQESAIYIARDTVLHIHDTVDFYIRKNNMDKSDEFYRQVESKMSKNKWSSTLHGFLFQSGTGVKRHDEQLSEMRFAPYTESTIDTIQYQHLDVFGTNINDTTVHSSNKYLKSVNKFHYHTRPWIVGKNLTFKNGDAVRPIDMVDTERLLRRLPYIKDARVFVVSGTNNDRALVTVVTKDLFPYNVLLSPDNDNSASWGISNVNIAGIGHEFEYNYIDQGGSEFFYRIRNIAGTFIDSELIYANNLFRTGYAGILDRPFVTQQTKYAGGAEVSNFDISEVEFEPVSDSIYRYNYDDFYGDIWIGRAFSTNFKSKFLGFHSQSNVVTSMGYSVEKFSNGPVATPDTNFFFHDKANILIGIGLQSREYYKDKFVINYGRTEDIPSGGNIGIVTGLQIDEFINRYYLGFNYARGGYIKQFGYLNGIFSLGGFVGSDGLTDGIFRIGGDYFTRLYLFNSYKFRQFVTITYTHALRPREDILLRDEKDLGIRGVNFFFLKSTRLFNIRLESLLFTPVNVVGFRLATFVFADMTYTANEKNAAVVPEFYSGFGFGIRLRNDNLAISTIQLRVGFYPNVPTTARTEAIDLSTFTTLQIRDFDFKEPQILTFTQSR